MPTPTLSGATDEGLLAGCIPRKDWQPWIVQPGDTLYSLALRANISLIALRDGNCFTYARGILEGESVLAPQQPAEIDFPQPDYPAIGESLPAIGCHASASIASPAPMAEVSDIIAIIGSADAPSGGSYRLSVKPAWAEDYEAYFIAHDAKANEKLGLLNTEIFVAGLHYLRLETLDAQGAQIADGSCEIPLVFEAPRR